MDIEKRIKELSAEIRAYPTPIAACDEQLSALIDERQKLMERLKTGPQSSCPPENIWVNDGGSSPGGS